MKAFFLAAGFGTRLRPFTNTAAKPSISFLGLPQILYPYFFCKELNINDIYYNTHHHAESLIKVFEDYKIKATNYHESEILNSAGGLSHAREGLENDPHFLVLNADTLFIYTDITPFKDIIQKHVTENRLATLITIPKEGCGISFPGLEFDSNKNLVHAGKITEIYPETQTTQNAFEHFIGLYIFSKRIFDFISNKPDNLIYDILLKIPQSEKNKIKVESIKNVDWYELGTIKDYKTNYLQLEEMLESNIQNSFTRTHHYFKTSCPEHYPYDLKLEQQILRSL